MTLFGQTLDGQQLFGLISMLAVLALWIVSLNRERVFQRWLKNRQLEQHRAAKADQKPEGGAPRGPWS